jgi:hypothetical protein
MGRVQSASLMVFDRPLLGQMGIATVLVGGAAALSSAGIALPVSNVGFTAGWDEQAPAAPRALPARAAEQAPVSKAILAPLPAFAPYATSVPATRVAAALTESRVRIELEKPSRLALVTAQQTNFTPGLVAMPLPSVEAPETALAIPPAAVELPASAPKNPAAIAAAVVPEIAPPGIEPRLAETAMPMRLVNPPELRGFDLAKLAGPKRSAPEGFARPAAKSPVSGKVEGLGKKDSVVGDAVYHQLTVSVSGSDGKTVDVRIGADMKPSIKVGDLLALVSDRMDQDSAARFAAASGAGDYVSLATLRAAGFDVSYNAGADTISISVSQ